MAGHSMAGAEVHSMYTAWQGVWHAPVRQLGWSAVPRRAMHRVTDLDKQDKGVEQKP